MRSVFGTAFVLFAQGACSDAGEPLVPGAGSMEGTGTGTLAVEGVVEVSSRKINAAARSDFAAELTVRVLRGSDAVSSGAVTITTATGKIPLTYQLGRWRAAAPVYDEVYVLDIASGPDRVDAVRIEGPDVHVFSEPSPGQTVPAGIPLLLVWKRSRRADAAAVRSDATDSVDIPDDGAYELPPGALRPDSTRAVNHTLRLARTNRVIPAGATAGSILRVTIENQINVRTEPTPPL